MVWLEEAAQTIKQIQRGKAGRSQAGSRTEHRWLIIRKRMAGSQVHNIMNLQERAG